MSQLDPDERRKAKEKEEESLNAGITYEAVRREGVKELDRSASALAWSGIAGGLSMGLSLVVEGILHHALPETPWRHAVASLGYPVGFLAITLGSQQLFTENTLTPIVPLLSEKTAAMLRKVATLWLVVLVANLVGTFLFAWAAARTQAFPWELRQAFRTLALASMAPDALATFARGVVAGWIIALMVWMLPAASASKVAVVVIMAWIIGAAKLAHVVVGSVKAFYLVVLGDMGIGAAFAGYILPSLAGNVIGGLVLVAALNHAQVVADE